MECLGPQCASMLLDWLRARAAAPAGPPPAPRNPPQPRTPRAPASPARQGVLWAPEAEAYHEEAPAIRSPAELAGAFEHLEYAVFRRYQNQLTRAERTRLDNSIRAALFKVDRYVARQEGPDQIGRAVQQEC